MWLGFDGVHGRQLIMKTDAYEIHIPAEALSLSHDKGFVAETPDSSGDGSSRIPFHSRCSNADNRIRLLWPAVVPRVVQA
jgi:hypothetical protein